VYNYLRSGFLLDFCTSLPYDQFIALGTYTVAKAALCAGVADCLLCAGYCDILLDVCTSLPYDQFIALGTEIHTLRWCNRLPALRWCHEFTALPLAGVSHSLPVIRTTTAQPLLLRPLATPCLTPPASCWFSASLHVLTILRNSPYPGGVSSGYGSIPRLLRLIRLARLIKVRPSAPHR
jgi:hypothetical protein